jgi:hypothetical protein
MAEPGGQVGIGEEDGTGFLGDLDGIADVVAVAMGEKDVRDAFGRFLEVLTGKARVMRQEGIEKDGCLRGLDAKGGMAQPSDLHEMSP